MSDINTIVATEQNFIVKRGDTLGPIVFKFYSVINGAETPIDITTDSFIMNVVISKGMAPALSFTVGSGFVIQNINELVLSKSAAQMQVKAGQYFYDMQRTTLSGIVSTEMTGFFKIIDDL